MESRQRDPGAHEAVEPAPAAMRAATVPAIEGPLTAAGVIALQQSAGNAAVSRLIEGGDAQRPPVAPAASPIAPATGPVEGPAGATAAAITERIGEAKADVSGQAADTRAALTARFAQARTAASASFGATRSRLVTEAVTTAQRAMELGTAKSTEVRAAGKDVTTRIAGATARHDRDARAVAEAGALRASTTSRDLAAQATETGESAATSATGDADLREDKAEAFREVASDTSKHVLDSGTEAAKAARSMASDATDKFGEDDDELTDGVGETAAQAATELFQMGFMLGNRLRGTTTEFSQQLDPEATRVTSAIDAAEAEAMAGVAQSEAALLAQLDQIHADAQAALAEQMQRVDAELAGADESADASAVIAAGHAEALTALDDALAGGTDAFASGSAQALAGVDAHLAALTGGLGSALDGYAADATAQLGEKVAQLDTKTAEGAKAATDGLGDIAGAKEKAVDDSLGKLTAGVGKGVDETLDKSRADVTELGTTRIPEAGRRVEAKAEEGFWSKVWGKFKTALLVGLIFVVAPLVAIGLLFGAEVAAVVGLIVLAVAGIYSIYTRLKSLYDEGAPWYQWAIYVVGLPVFLVLDVTGIGGTIEGGTGYDIVTWRQLSEDEAAARMGTGLAGMVLLLISLGLAKVAPKAPPEPTPRPPAPPELTPGDPVPADPVPAEDPNAPVPEVTVERDALAQELGLDRTLFDRLSEDLAGRLRQLMQGLSRDRIGGLRRYLQRNLERGRWPDPLVEDLLTMPDDELPEFLDRQAGVTWEPNWRGEPHIEDGNAAEGWQHINERHITGDQPGGDLFPEGTTRAEVEAAAEEVVARGTRLSNPARRMQVFEDRVTVHGRVFRVRVTVDAVDGRVITVFPVITGP